RNAYRSGVRRGHSRQWTRRTAAHSKHDDSSIDRPPGPNDADHGRLRIPRRAQEGPAARVDSGRGHHSRPRSRSQPNRQRCRDPSKTARPAKAGRRHTRPGFGGLEPGMTARKRGGKGTNGPDETHETAQARAHAAEERFQLVVGSVKDYAIFVLDANGCVATWNAGARLIKGYLREDVLGKHSS